MVEKKYIKLSDARHDHHAYLNKKTVALNKLGHEIDRILGIENDTKIIQLRKQA